MQKILLILLLFLMTACAPAATAFPEDMAATEPPALLEPVVPTEVVIAPETLASATLPAPTSTEAPPTSTPIPAITVPTRTETALPTLELPSPVANPPALAAWDGEPTYSGDSQEGFFFRVMYNPELWALTTDNFGSPALAHRALPDCIIVPSVGRGLPSNVTVDHDFRKVGAVEYEVNTAYLAGVPQFITYLGGDLKIYTGFEVSFKEQADACIADAETVLGTLISIPISEATPSP
ncbi:MAG: hypothetical protein AB1649_21110 [Chloroflexota bacterium]